MQVQIMTMTLLTSTWLATTSLAAPTIADDAFDLFMADVLTRKAECAMVLASREARVVSKKINLWEASKAQATLDNHVKWFTTPEHQDKHDQVQAKVYEKYTQRHCQAGDYSPAVRQLNNDLSCLQICRDCFPGSIAVCLLRRPGFKTIGQTCMCTYSTEDPINDAAFSVRHDGQLSR